MNDNIQTPMKKKMGRPIGSKNKKTLEEERNPTPKPPKPPRKKPPSRLPQDEEGIQRRLDHIRALVRARRMKHAKKRCFCACGRDYKDPSARIRHENTKVHQRLMAEAEK